MDRKIYTLDRFEGKYAVLIDGEARRFDVVSEIIPGNAREGDALYFADGGFVIDGEHTRRKSEEIKNRFERLKKKS